METLKIDPDQDFQKQCEELIAFLQAYCLKYDKSMMLFAVDEESSYVGAATHSGDMHEMVGLMESGKAEMITKLREAVDMFPPTIN